MALTRVIAAKIIVSRLGPMMEVAQMAVTIAGANADLNDPFAWATRMVGHPTASHETVTAGEMALIALADYDDFMALAEWRVLKNMLGAFDAVDIGTGPFSTKLSQHAAQVQKMLDALEPTIAALGALGTATLTTGYISLDFAEHYEARL